MERRAAQMGGGGLVAPVQRVTDFLSAPAAAAAAPLPTSSYRLGVREAPLDALYPAHVTAALRAALGAFEARLPGFATSDAGLLHGVETRTSAPVQIVRGAASLQCARAEGLYPTGERVARGAACVRVVDDGVASAADLEKQTE
jgi:uncharacterized FAD-dependent dehydrogenase